MKKVPKSDKKRATLGLDIGGTRIKSVVLSVANPPEILGTFDVPSRASENPDAVLGAIREVITEFQGRGLSFQAVGAGCAGSVDGAKGVIRNSPNFHGWHNFPLARRIAEITNLPTAVDNDANCAVYGEWRMGGLEWADHVVLLTLGTGIGGGLILDRRLYRGATGTAGELGHFSIYVDGLACPCGSRGCFERYCSGSALMDRSGLEPRIFFENLRSDGTLQAIWKSFVADFCSGITSLANIFDPDVFVLGGAVSEGLKPYATEIAELVKKRAFPSVASHFRLQFASQGNLSGSIGAALLAAQEL